MHTLGFDYEADRLHGLDDRHLPGQLEGAIRDADHVRHPRGDGPDRETLDHLSGYEGATPVRIGNAAYSQRQNDVYGALLDSIYIHAKVQDHVPKEMWEAIARQVDTAAEVWPKPDQGIWEARGDPKHYVSSKLMCWVALDRGHRLADRAGDAERSERWAKIADEIRADILEKRSLGTRRLPPALRDGRPRRVHPAGPPFPLPAAGRRACGQHRQRDRG